MQEREQTFQGAEVGERGESKGVRERNAGSAAACGGALGRDLGTEEIGRLWPPLFLRSCSRTWRHTHLSLSQTPSWTLCQFLSHRKQVPVELDVQEAYRVGHHVVDQENLPPTVWASLRKEGAGWEVPQPAGQRGGSQPGPRAGAPEGRRPCAAAPTWARLSCAPAPPAPHRLRADTLRCSLGESSEPCVPMATTTPRAQSGPKEGRFWRQKPVAGAMVRRWGGVPG